MALPGVLFWAVIVCWTNDHRSGEHYEYLVLSWLAFFTAVTVCAACVVVSVIMMWKDRPSRYWWLAALVNLTPMWLYLEMVL